MTVTLDDLSDGISFLIAAANTADHANEDEHEDNEGSDTDEEEPFVTHWVCCFTLLNDHLLYDSDALSSLCIFFNNNSFVYICSFLTFLFLLLHFLLLHFLLLLLLRFIPVLAHLLLNELSKLIVFIVATPVPLFLKR